MRWAALVLAGCFHATAVVPVPASDLEMAEIQGVLRSHSWESRRWREEPGGNWRSDTQPTLFVFTQREATVQPGGGVAICDHCRYRLDGRNVRIERPEGGEFTFRVDVSERGHVQLFWYDLSRSLDLVPIGSNGN